MRLMITCFKESGKYYAQEEITVPDLTIEGNNGRILDTYATRDYLIGHPDLWPVTNLDSFHTVITLAQDCSDIQDVPIMIPVGFQQAPKRPYVPMPN